MIYEFHPEALYEFQESAVFYNSQQPGLGDRFIAAVQSAVDHIVSSPEAWRVIEGDVRRFLTKILLYTIERDYILIVAVMHCHREPGYWHHRI